MVADPTGPTEQDLEVELEVALGYGFLDRELLRTALTHRSYSNEAGADRNYERLEFLGDSVLGLVAAQWLYLTHPERPEGQLAKLKSYLVSTTVLGRYARRLGVGNLLRLGVGEERSGGRTKNSILADALEAILGAVFVDGGFAAARQVILPMLELIAAERPQIPASDAKTHLQELIQARGLGLPQYRLVEEEGPDHRKSFTVDCWIDGRAVAQATGPSKKQAEQLAASAAIHELDLLAGGS